MLSLLPLPEQQEPAKALPRGAVVPVHRAHRVPCPRSCRHRRLSAWGEAWPGRPLCPGGPWARTEPSAQDTPPLASHRRAAPARCQPEEDSSSEKMLSILMQTLMILHHRKKPGGEEKAQTKQNTEYLQPLVFTQISYHISERPRMKSSGEETSSSSSFLQSDQAARTARLVAVHCWCYTKHV